MLAEVYDVSRNATRLTGLAMLGSVTEGEPLVPGMVVAGNSPRTLMVRAIGPGLTAFGLSSDVVLGQPRVVVLNSQGQSITNSQSQTAGSADAVAAGLPAVGAFPQPASADASVVNAFTPGAYTLQVAAAPLSVAAQASANFIAPNQTGTVLVEIYEVP